jgi:hypothetical protein
VNLGYILITLIILHIEAGACYIGYKWWRSRKIIKAGSRQLEDALNARQAPKGEQPVLLASQKILPFTEASWAIYNDTAKKRHQITAPQTKPKPALITTGEFPVVNMGIVHELASETEYVLKNATGKL